MSSAFLLFGLMLVMMVFGIPIAFSIGLSGTVYLMITGMRELILVPQRAVIGTDSFVLLAIPLFTFAGYLMEQGGLSRRLVNWVERIFGFFPGSTGTISIICCTIFAALTGSGPATVAAIGALMIPSMLQNGYTKRTAAGIIAAGGALGPIIPPSIAMIVYGSAMNLSIPQMFLASIIPGLFISFLFIIVNTIYALSKGIKGDPQRYSFKEIVHYTWKALPVLMLPVIVLGGIYGGIFTPTEAASVCTIYSLMLAIVYKEMDLKRFLDACRKTVVTSSMVMFIVGISNLFGWLLSATRIPSIIAAAAIPYCRTPEIYMLILMFILFFIGCLMDTIPAILILAPILVPIGVTLGLDPLHLGVVFCINLIVGFISPPFGINLFTVSSTAGVPFAEVVKGVWPYILAAVIGVMILAYVPGIALFLPRLAN